MNNKLKVIATHHAPVMDCSNSDGEYEVQEIRHAFSSPLSHLLSHSPVHAWLFGHTHWYIIIIIIEIYHNNNNWSNNVIL